MLVEILLGVVVLLLIVLIALFLTKSSVQREDVESAVSHAWMRLGLAENVGKLTAYAEDIRDNYRSLEQMLRVPTERACLGEMALERVLTDQLPRGMFGIRKRVLHGLIPDAHIQSTAGVICIDSKFPLENYSKMMQTADCEQKERYGKRFLRDVRGHLEKIRNDYVCPQNGSADFAFAYIPSEGIYWFLVNEGFELLRGFSKEGVQVVSPLTLTHKIQLIRAGVHAKKLSEEAERVSADLGRLSEAFTNVDAKWTVFYETHLRNLRNKAHEVNSSYGLLREEFDKIASLTSNGAE